MLAGAPVAPKVPTNLGRLQAVKHHHTLLRENHSLKGSLHITAPDGCCCAARRPLNAPGSWLCTISL